MKRAAFALVCALAASTASILPVFAQSADLTEAEIIERFKQQKTRGLSIAPVTPQTETGNAAATAVTPATISTMPVEQQVNINISFDFDSAALRADQKPKLVALCGAMQAVEGEVFRILGHTDASGSADYNQRLSLLRAEEVKRHLVSECGIAPERLEATGVGEDHPLDPANPRGDVNRRVEFQVVG